MNIGIQLITRNDTYEALQNVAEHIESILERDNRDIVSINIEKYGAEVSLSDNELPHLVKELKAGDKADDVMVLILEDDNGKQENSDGFLYIGLHDKCVVVRGISKSQRDATFRWSYIILKVIAIYLINDQTCHKEGCIRSSDSIVRYPRKVNVCYRCQEALLERIGSPRMVDRICRMIERIDELSQLSIMHNEVGEGCPGSEMLWINKKSTLTFIQDKMGFGPLKETSPQLPFDMWRWITGDADYWWLRSVSHLIRKSEEVDVFSYLTQKRSRDHYKHQIYVAGLGWRLLELKVNPKETMGQYFLRLLRNKYGTNNKVASSLSEEHIYQAWFLASLLHDVGYPLAHLIATYVNIHGDITFDGKMVLDMLGLCRNLSYHIWGEFLNNLSRGPGGDDKEKVSMAVMTELRRLLERCFTKKNLDFCQALHRHSFFRNNHEGKTYIREIFDHGLWSVASIISSLPMEKTDFSQFSVANIILWEALQAIALHNESDIATFQGLDLAAAPLAFLLILCDEVQEWDRGIVKQGRFVKPEIEHVSMGPFFLLSGELYFDERLQVSFHCPDSKRLKESDWLYEKFTESKINLGKILSSFKKPEDFRPNEFQFRLSINV